MATSNLTGQRRPGLVLLSGLPGSGKTSFARALAAQIACDHLESDAVRRALVSRPAYTPAEHTAVFGRLERMAEAALLAGRTVLLDATNLVADDRRRFVRLAVCCDAVLVAVRLTAPRETIRARLSSPRDGYSEADFGVYEAMQGRPRPFATPVVTVDTRYSLGPALDLVARLLKDLPR